MTSLETSRDWVEALLPEPPVAGDGEYESVGELDLAQFQRRAVRRGLSIARTFGGVVVADTVGLGKTRVALAIGRSLGRDSNARRGRSTPVWIVVPARLRDQWRRSATRADLGACRIVSHTELSRQEVDADEAPPAALIVDEAHRFRNPDANRSRQLAELADRAPVVMATATPVCNDYWDLYHLLSVFLGESDTRPLVGRDLREAFEAAERGTFDLVRLVQHFAIRRIRAPEVEGFGERPGVTLEATEYDPGEAESRMWSNLESELRGLSLEALSGDWPPELFIRYVIRRWESGPDALVETLEQLVAYHRRWLEARRCGRRLDRSEFRDLFEAAPDQEVFPFFFPSGGGEESGEAAVEAVDADRRRLQELLERAKEVRRRNSGMAEAIVELAAGDQKWLIFTRYRRAARGLFRALCDGLGASARVGLATGSSARATGLEATSLDELLRRFAPESYAGRDLPRHQQLRVLVATDCLAEGVNLQQCGRVVLADLPYSALAVEQRIGRVVRPGGPHDEVVVYLPRPANWDDTLGMQRRLERKLTSAEKAGAKMPKAEVLADGAGGIEGRALTRGGGMTGGDDRWAGPDAPAKPAPAEEPLAAMTRLDGLAQRLEAPDEMEGMYWSGALPAAGEALWVRYAVDGRPNDRGGWLLVDESGGVECRRTSLVRPLVALADAELSIRREEPPGHLLEPAQAWLDEADARHRAVARAPFPLDVESPQYRAWRRICRELEEGELEWSGDRVETWRHRLLRPLPRGARLRLRELVDATDGVSRLVRGLRRLLSGRNRVKVAVEHRMVATLWLRPRAP